MPRSGAAQDRTIVFVDPGVRRDTLLATQDQPFQLKPFIIDQTFSLVGDGIPIDEAQYHLDRRNGLLWVQAGLDDVVVLVAEYQHLPLTVKDVYRNRSIAASDSLAPGDDVIVEERKARSQVFDPFGNTRLQRSGSITRGVIAGNTRDVTVESGLRMQLSGEVVEGVNVRAVLTDENTPILPEGTTQRLSEFDRVFIEVQTDRATAQLGDFDLAYKDAEFARFSRKLQGATAFGDVPGYGSFFDGASVSVAGAASKGIFRLQEIAPVESVQGPYRLEGDRGEPFIIVVPGSERIYMDGVLLTRGETNDYVIDYATAEVTFTPTRFIRSDRRISVEFQYSTNQFTRTLIGSSVESRLWRGSDGRARARIGATYLRESDSREFDEEFGFTASDSARVAGAGDGSATRSGAEEVVFDPEAPYVQYVANVASGVPGRPDTVYVPLNGFPAPGLSVFRVRFSRVGDGKGSYARVGGQSNGIAYEYQGSGKGAYEPVRFLPKPKQQRLLDVRASVQPLTWIEVFGEWAHSVNDLNRLSSLDSDDDKGNGYVSGVNIKPVPIASTGLTLSGGVRRRFTGAHFSTFDRTRPVEFRRQWNLLTRSVNATGAADGGGGETTDEARLEIGFSPLSQLRAEVGRIALSDDFNATRTQLALSVLEPNAPSVSYRITYINSEDDVAAESGRWIRQLASVRRPFLSDRLVPRFEVEQERRRQRVLDTDSLTGTSFSFVEFRPGVAWKSQRLEGDAEVEVRTEGLWLDGQVQDAATSWTVETGLKYRAGRLLSANGRVGYRVQRFEEIFRVRQQRENSESVVIQLNGTYRPLQRAVVANWFYEAQTERTPKLQEIYVRTGPELGQYIWHDDNGDGAIQLEEFVRETTPNEGAYVKTFIPSDSLFSIISLKARVRVDLDPGLLWKDATGAVRRLLSKVSTRTSVEVQEKSREEQLSQIYLLNLRRFRKPGSTLNGRLIIRQEVSLFRRSTGYGIDVSFAQTRGLSDLATGEESRFLHVWRVNVRYKPVTAWTLRINGSTEINRVQSASFSSRRYNLRSRTLSPEATFSASRHLSFKLRTEIADRTDRDAARSSRSVRVPFETRYRRARRLQVTGLFEVASVRLNGEAAGQALFELTDGRGSGTSYLWSVGSQYALNRFMRANISYDGRAPSGAPVVHTLRMQLSALF